MNLDQLNFTHPECGGLTDIEREMLFYIRYFPCGPWSLKRYIESITGTIQPSTEFLNQISSGVNIGFISQEVRGIDTILRLTEDGRAIVDAMEAGGW